MRILLGMALIASLITASELGAQEIQKTKCAIRSETVEFFKAQVEDEAKMIEGATGVPRTQAWKDERVESRMWKLEAMYAFIVEKPELCPIGTELIHPPRRGR